jgi:hypothetical protein
VTVDKTAKQLNSSIASAYSVMPDNLQFHKVCARGVPKELTDEHKHMCLNICSRHSAHCHEEGDNFLQWIVTGDETWVHCYQPETKKSMQWKHSSPPVAKKFKTQPSAGKLMLAIIWDSQRLILETYLECGTTVTSATYCDMLRRGLKPAICSKRRWELSEGVLSLHDNARPHTAARTLENLRKLKWEVMEHGFHLFGPLTEAIGGKRF